MAQDDPDNQANGPAGEEGGGATGTSPSEDRPRGRTIALYPNEYVWFVFVSAMDVFMTSVVLSMGGSEVNEIADWVLQNWGLRGLVVFKFALVLLVIGCCEIIGRHRLRTGRWLARFGVGVTAAPMVWAFTLLIAGRLG